MSDITCVYKLLSMCWCLLHVGHSNINLYPVVAAAVKDPSELPSKAPNLYVMVHLSNPRFNIKTTTKKHSYQPEWKEEFLM
ncbi:hypothetical protein B0H21DRAFT_754191 [Amylocystis lapponica]|nr:hypothetical protein B0H21DRAFT_754191 [Amylocystis lapponica]